MNDTTTEDGAKQALKAKPTKILPTNRISFDGQMSILRAYAAASGPQGQPVSNSEVGKIVSDLAESSISLCNAFYCDVGLLSRDGLKQRPSQAVLDYLQAFEWDQKTAATKLKPVLENTWFAKALVPKLAFRQLTKDEAIAFLAEEAKASKEYKKQLETLLDFLGASGVVRYEGTTIYKVTTSSPPQPPAGNNGKPTEELGNNNRGKEGGNGNGDKGADDSNEYDSFEIPIPGRLAVKLGIPKNITQDDWDLFKEIQGIYLKRIEKMIISKKGVADNDTTKDDQL